MMVTASKWWVAVGMVMFACAGVVAMIGSVATRVFENATIESPIRIVRLEIDPGAMLPVRFEREIMADATGVWRVTYYKFGGGVICDGQGTADYLASEPLSYQWTHADWSGDPGCDRAIAASAPGRYWAEVQWTLTHWVEDIPVTTAEQRLVPFEIK
jgi:hypothetical protein